MTTIRWMASLALGALITLVLFYFMQSLIATGSQVPQTATVIPVVDATMPEIELELDTVIEKPEPIIDPEVPPPPPDRVMVVDKGPVTTPPRVVVTTDEEINPDRYEISDADGPMIPLVSVAPQYPTRAASRGTQGWAMVSFTVTETGGVRDVEVVDSEPPGTFDNSAIRAAEQFRFKPRIIDGEAVAVPGVQYVFRFTMNDQQ